ncbi:nitrous oxide reductase family maturation protein NosD [Nitratifractor sp.]
MSCLRFRFFGTNLSLLFFAFLSASSFLSAAVALQPVIDAAPAGSRIDLPPGKYRGPIRIDKALILQGSGSSTVIEGSGRGTVVKIGASHVTLRALTLRHSGRRRENMDAAIRIDRASDIGIEKCRIEDALFGIVAEESRRIRFLGNDIASIPEKVVDNRGDGIRLWDVTQAEIRGNRLHRSRDLSILRSRNLLLDSNAIIQSRYGILLEMDHNVTARRNRLVHNYAGILLKGGADLTLRENFIARSRSVTGTGILLSGGRKIRVLANRIVGCAQGLYIDTGASERGMRRWILGNQFLANTSALHFHAAIRNNTIRKNIVKGNLEDVTVDLRSPFRKNNEISGNYWDRYEGFDRDHDGFGDTPYQVWIYADKLWEYDHHLRWFYATPLMSLLDFIERIAPFDEPDLLFVDPHPRMQPPSCVKED